MCKTWSIVYTCDHTFTFRLSTCQESFMHRQPGFVCQGPSLLALRSASRCGRCSKAEAEGPLEREISLLRERLSPLPPPPPPPSLSGWGSGETTSCCSSSSVAVEESREDAESETAATATARELEAAEMKYQREIWTIDRAFPVKKVGCWRRPKKRKGKEGRTLAAGAKQQQKQPQQSSSFLPRASSSLRTELLPHEIADPMTGAQALLSSEDRVGDHITVAADDDDRDDEDNDDDAGDVGNEYPFAETAEISDDVLSAEAVEIDDDDDDDANATDGLSSSDSHSWSDDTWDWADESASSSSSSSSCTNDYVEAAVLLPCPE